MNISFDLDLTLIPSGNEFETENRSRIAAFFGVEKIRKDAGMLISELQKEGHIIHIYTTSFRGKRNIRRTLRYYGIKVCSIINETENRKILKERNINASKYPTAFGFDLHIDDSKGVGMEADRLKFKAIIIDPKEENWISIIKTEVKKIRL